MKPGYGRQHQLARAALLAANPWCVHCGAPATVADHVPPLCTFPHPDLWRGELVSSCAKCSWAQGGHLSGSRSRRRYPQPSRRW